MHFFVGFTHPDLYVKWENSYWELVYSFHHVGPRDLIHLSGLLYKDFSH